MGKKEYPMVEYYNQNQRFAELVNGALFDGETILKADELTGRDRRLEPGSNEYKMMAHQRTRDLWKEANGMYIHVMIGGELQESIDYMMVLRSMDMNVLGYNLQRKDIMDKNKKDSSLTGGEFLSKFRKDDKLIPEITFVLYLGKKPWDAPRNLYELLDFEKVPEKLKRYIDNYHLHILDVRRMSDEEILRFPGDIGFMLWLVKNSDDKEKWRNMKELIGREDWDDDTHVAITRYFNEPLLDELRKKHEKGGKVNMCKGLRDLLADERSEGKAEGKIQSLIILIQKKVQKGKTLTETAGELEETAENISGLYTLIKEHPNEDVEKIMELMKAK